MRRQQISTFATLALLLAACQELPTAVPVVDAPESPAPAAPAPAVVEVETPTRLLPNFDAEPSAPAAPMVAAEMPAPAPPMVAEESPAPAPPMVAADPPKRRLPAEPLTQAGPIVVLAVGQSARIRGGALLRFDTLESDSRCQPKVQCIWAGNAQLSLVLDESPFAINTMDEPHEKVVGGYRFQLVGLTQRAQGDTVSTNYSATFKVTR